MTAIEKILAKKISNRKKYYGESIVLGILQKMALPQTLLHVVSLMWQLYNQLPEIIFQNSCG